MKPDIRPVKVLTRAILDTSPAWVLLTAGNGYIYPSAGLRLDGALLLAPDGLCFFDHQRCYPCKADAPFEPIPWPFLLGEVEIPQWRGKTTALDEDAIDILNGCYWWTDSEGQHRSVLFRDDELPAPRRQINRDGTETPVWVWEADR